MAESRKRAGVERYMHLPQPEKKRKGTGKAEPR